MDDVAALVTGRLSEALAASRSKITDLTETCARAEDRADEISTALRQRWQRRIELLRARASADAGREERAR